MANQGHSANSGDTGDDAESNAYINKFKEMQKYIPFLETMISRLEKTNDKSREAQLLKMKSLLTILSSSKKKLKLETLMRCETVLEKLMEKVEKSTLNQAKQTASKENKGRNTDSVQDSFRLLEKRDDIVSSTTQTADPPQSVADIVKSLKLAAARSKQQLSENQNVPKNDDWEPSSVVTSTDNENFVTSSENKVNVNLFEHSREKLKNLAVSNQLPSVKVQDAESETHNKSNNKNEIETLFSSKKLCRTNAEHISVKELWNPENVDRDENKLNSPTFISDCSPPSNRQKCSSRLPETLRSSKSPLNVQTNNSTFAQSPSELDRSILEKSEEPSTPKSLRAKLEQEIHKVHRVGVSTGGALRSLVNKDDRKTSPIKAKNDNTLKNSDKSPQMKKDIDTLSSGLKNNSFEKDLSKSAFSSKLEEIEKWKRPLDPRRRQSQETTRPLTKLAQSVTKPKDSVSLNIGKNLEPATGDKQDPRFKYGTHFNTAEPASNQDVKQSPANSDSSSILANMSTEDLQRLVHKNVRNLPSPPPITKEILETVKGSSPTTTHWKSNTFNTEVKQGTGSYQSAENFQRYSMAHTTNYNNPNIPFDQQRHPVYDNPKDSNYVAPRPSLLPTPNMMPADHLRVLPSHVAAQDPRLINSRARNIDSHNNMNKFPHSSSICDPRINPQRPAPADNRIGIDPRYSNSEYSRTPSRERWSNYVVPPTNSSDYVQETFHPQNRILDQSREREQQRCRMPTEQFSPVGQHSQWPVQQHKYNIPNVSNYMPCMSTQSVSNSHSDPRHSTNQHFYGNRSSTQHIESPPPGQRLPQSGTHFGSAAKRIQNLSERDPRRRSIEELDSNKRSPVSYKDRRSRPADPRHVSFTQSRCNERKKEDKNVDSSSFQEKQLDSKQSKEKEIISPLNSLYENTSVAKTGKGYGFQNFRIPKIKRETTSRPKSPPPQHTIKEIDEEKVDELVSNDDKISMDKSENVEKVQEPDNEKAESTDHVTALKKEDVTQELIEALIRKSFESGEGKKLLEQAIILDNLNDKLKSKKLRKIQQILASDTEDSDNDSEEKKEATVANSSHSDDQSDTTKSKVQKSKRTIVSEDSEDNQESKQENSNDNFEQLKKRGGRRRKVDASIKIDANKKELESIGKDEDVKRGRKRRSPLELLQEDIREMFISEGVVTATGYRMCRLLKEAKPGVSIEEISRSEAKRMVEEEADDESESKNENRKKRRGRPKCKKETFEDETDEILDQNVKRTRRRTRKNSSDEYADEKSLHNDVCGDTEDKFDDELDTPLECRKYRKASGSKKLLQKSDVNKVRSLPCVVIEKTDMTKFSKSITPHVEDLSECDSEDGIHVKNSKKQGQRNVSRRGRGKVNISKSFKKDVNYLESDFSEEPLKPEKLSLIDRFTSQESFRFKRCREKRGPYILQKKISDVIAKLSVSKGFETNDNIGSNNMACPKDVKSSDEQVILKNGGDLGNNSKCSVKKTPTPKKQKKKKPRWQLGIIRKKVIYKPKSDLRIDHENVDVNNENVNVLESADTNKHSDSNSFHNSEINVSRNEENITGGISSHPNVECVTEEENSLRILKHIDNIDKFQSELLSDEKEKDVNESVSNIGPPSKEIQDSFELQVAENEAENESENIELIPSQDIPSPNLSDVDSDIEKKDVEKKKNAGREPKQVDADESNVLDTSYAFNGSIRYNCKLCYFFGKAITSHYKHQHPTHEVYISRLSIEESSQAIKESFENNYDSIQFDELKSRGRKKIDNIKDSKKKETFQYFCRMCDLKTSSLFYFQEHQTTHTGEYRYQCDICSNVFVSKSSFKGHFYNHHQGLNLIKGENWRILLSLSTFDNKVFGYICSSCNFVQMTKENVEKHISSMHMDCETNKTNLPKVICINMSKCNFTDTDKFEESSSMSENLINVGELSVVACGETDSNSALAECILDNSQKTTNNPTDMECTETNSGSVEKKNLIDISENKNATCQNSVEVQEISLDSQNEVTEGKTKDVCDTGETVLSIVNNQIFKKEVCDYTSTTEKLSNCDKTECGSDSNNSSSFVENNLEYSGGKYTVKKCPERKTTKIFKHAFMASKCQEKQEEQLHIKRLKQMEEVSGNIKLRPKGTSHVLQLFDFINILHSSEYSQSPERGTQSSGSQIKTSDSDIGLVTNDIKDDSTLIDEKRAIEAAQAVKLLGEDCQKTNVNEGNINQDHTFFSLEGDLPDNMLDTKLNSFNTSFTQVLWRSAKRVFKPSKQLTGPKMTESNETEIDSGGMRELVGSCATENIFSIYPNQIHRLCNTISEDTKEKVNSDCNILDSHNPNSTDISLTTLFTKEHCHKKFSEISPPPAVTFELNKRQSMSADTSKAILSVEVGSFIAVMYEQNKIVYTCKVQGCIFETIEIDPFLEHLQLRHRNFHWDGMCQTCCCMVEFDTSVFDVKKIPLSSAFEHLLDKHTTIDKVTNCFTLVGKVSDKLLQAENDSKRIQKSNSTEIQNKFMFKNSNFSENDSNSDEDSVKIIDDSEGCQHSMSKKDCSSVESVYELPSSNSEFLFPNTRNHLANLVKSFQDSVNNMTDSQELTPYSEKSLTSSNSGKSSPKLPVSTMCSTDSLTCSNVPPEDSEIPSTHSEVVDVGITENICEEKPKAYLRMRRLSGDMLSVPKLLDDDDDEMTNNEDYQDSQIDLQELNDEHTDGENDNVPFLKIANVVSLNPYAANSIEGFEGLNSFLEESSKESVSSGDVQEDSVVAEKCTTSDDPVIVPNKSPVILKKVGKPSFVVLSPLKNLNSSPVKPAIHVLPSTAFSTSVQSQSGMKIALTKSSPSAPTSLVNLRQIKPGQIYQNPSVTNSVPTSGKVYRKVLPKTTLVTLKVTRVPTQVPPAFNAEQLPSSEIPANQQESLTVKNSVSHNLSESDLRCTKKCDTPTESDWSKVDNSKTKRFNKYSQDSEYCGSSKLPTAFEGMRTYQKLRHLYKCMDRSCVFSTDSASSFMNHCTKKHAHDEKSDWLQCPYCHSTPSTASELKDHITLEHGHCLFQCAYCFFRGMAQCYIVLHQNMKHISGIVSVLLCNKPESVPERHNQLVPLETVVLPYICSQGNCRVMLYNPKDFLHHLEWQHNTLTSFVCDICQSQYLKPGRLISHYKLHSLAMYQCRHCLHGSETEEEIQHHLCNLHHNQPALAILRNFNPNLAHNKKLKEIEKLVVLDLEKGMSDDVLIKPSTEDLSDERNIVDVEDFLDDSQSGKHDANSENGESQPDLAVKALKSNSSSVEDHDSDIEIIESVVEAKKGAFSQSISEDDDDVCIISETDKGLSKAEKGNTGSLKCQTLVKDDTDNLKSPVTSKDVPDSLSNQAIEKGSTDNLINQAMEKGNVDNFGSQGIDDRKAVSLSCPANEQLEESDGFLNSENYYFCTKKSVSDNKIDDGNEANKTVSPTLEPSLGDNAHSMCTTNADVISELDIYINTASVNRTPEKGTLSDTRIKVEKDNYSSPSYSPGLGQVEESNSPTKLQSCNDGLTGDALFRCGNIGCYYSASSSSLLKEHLQLCDHSRDSTVLSCVHCNRQFKSANSLLEHLRVHGIKRYSCSLCSYRASKPLHVSKHLKQQHRVTATEIIPAIPQQSNTESDMFIVCPKGKGKSRRGSNSHQNNFSKTVFKPDESHLLPFSAILKDFVHCSLCSFKTKVRSNMKRHLDLHLDPTVDPSEIPKSEVVNPVPCLSRKEMMFDKMTNLAASSIMSSKSTAGGNTSMSATIKNVKVEEEFEAPKFVPESQRYVCGVVNCNYLTCTETMLRYHIRALHLENVEFRCPHCTWETVVSHPEVSVDRIASHLRIHDTRLYKCAHCSYCHYHRHIVERHLADKHPEKRMFVHVIREPETESRNDSSGLESAASSSETTLTNFNWVCGFCDFRCGTRADVLDHTSSVHNIKSQFKCSLCPYRSSSKSNFETHFNAKHQGQSPEVLDVYRRLEYLTDSGSTSNFGESFDLSVDTTPLWSRSKLRVRHIRGILIEDLNEELKHMRSTSIETINSSPQKKLVQVKNELVPEISCEKEVSEKIEVVKEKDEEEGMFGSYGKPNGNLYVCPLCNRYKSKIKADMRDHIYRELNYAKWVCTHCRLMSCSRNSLQKHSARVHEKDRKPEAIAPLTPDKDVEEYVEAVLTHQNTIMKSLGDLPSTLKRSYSDIKLNDESEGHKEQHGSRSKLRCEESDDNSVDIPFMKKASVAKAPEVSELSPPCSDVDVVGDEGDNDGGDDPPSKPKPSKQKKQGELICKHCEDTFTNVQGLKLHIRINHLNMGSWICGHCNCGSTSEVTLKQHCKTKHPHLPEAVINNKKAAKVKLDEEFWEREYGIRTKKKLQLPNADMQLEEDQQAPPLQESIPSIGPWTEQDELMGRKCNYCNYRCRNASDLRNHEMRHWVQKPFKCGHCSFEAIREYEVKKHSSRAHPQVQVNVIEKPVPIQPDIKPLRLKRRHEVPQESGTSPTISESPETFSENTTNDEDESSDASSISKTAKIFRCFYCPLRAGALATVHEHWVKVHKTGVVCANGVHKQALPFRYKELALLDILKGKSKLGMRASYVCEYCKIKGTLNSLKRHHEENHAGLPLHLIPGTNTQYECAECHFLAGVVSTLKKHFEVEHKEKQFHYVVKTIPSPMVEGISPVKISEDLNVGKYICLWCEESCETENSYESHHELYHSHLSSKCIYDSNIDAKKKYKYQCPKCVFYTDNYQILCDHLKRHLSSFKCVYCNKTFSSVGKVRNHTQVFHSGIEVKFSVIEEENIENFKTLIEKCTGEADISSQEVGGAQSEDQVASYAVRSVARKSTSLSSFTKRRKLEVARKSTNPLPNYGPSLMEDEETEDICQDEFSYYGRPPSPVDMCRTTAAVNCGGTILNMNIKTFSQICNIFPEVRVKDLKKEKLSPI